MEIKNFAILRGSDVKIENNKVSLIASQTEDENKKFASSEIRTDINYVNGVIEFKFKFSNSNSGIVFIFNTEDEVGVSIGISRTYDAFVIAEGHKKFSPIKKASTLKNFDINKEHKLKIDINGSFAKIFINNISILEGLISIKESPITFRISTEGKLEIYDMKVYPIKPVVFCVMQFSKEYNDLYNDVIKPICEELGYETIRADEFYTSTPILQDIIESIQNSTVIIAEITPDNPNVFYEIGYSHAIGKPTILLCDRKREKLPFDLSSFRTLFYENSIAGKNKIELNLRKYLSSIK